MVEAEAGADLRYAMSEVDAFFDGVFAPLEAWLPELVEQLRSVLAHGPVPGAQLAALVETRVHRILDGADRPLYGAGYCASERAASEGNPLAWWQGPERSLLASSTFGPGQAAIDLVRLEWYRVPEGTGTRHVAGPFVDYLCSNEITITSSMPVVINSEFVGVICADVLVSALERVLLPSLAAARGATLVNAGGRVVVSTDPDFETGDRYAGADPERGIGALVDEQAFRGRIARSERYPFALVLPA